MRRILIIVGGLLALSCLAGCTTVEDAYVAADRSTYETVGAEWAAYFRADETLDSLSKEIREEKLESWRLRIEAAEASE